MDFSTLDPQNYEKLLAEKKLKLKSMFSSFTTPEVEVFASEPTHFRMRSEFRVWHEGEDLYYYMFDKAQEKNIRTEQYLPASLIINQMMTALMEEVRPNQILRYKL